MKEIKIDTWKSYMETVESHSYRDWLYRGQSDSSWKLESSLHRTMERNIHLRSLGKNRKLTLKRELYEEEMIRNFKRSSHLFLTSPPEKGNPYDWLSVMQHYGAPTRMLDFSFSPYVALFFAISGIKKEASVYCIKHKSLQGADRNYFTNIKDKYNKLMEPISELSETLLMPYEPTYTNSRLIAQQGAFLIPNTLRFSHEEILSHYENDSFAYKLVIGEEIAFDFIERLAKINISYANMYPGLEGFCKSYENVGIIPINRLRPIE